MTKTQRYLAAAVLVCAVFVSSYVYAATRSTPRGTAATSCPMNGGPVAQAPCACCGGASGAAGAGATTGEATTEGDVQRISVDTSSGTWDPAQVVLKAGVPAEITFAEGQGCLAEVVFPELGVSADLTDGGATVEIPALDAGEYTFTCGMRMVFGTLTVR